MIINGKELRPEELVHRLKSTVGRRFIVREECRGYGEWSKIPAQTTGEVIAAYFTAGFMILITSLDGIGRRKLKYSQIRFLSPLEELASV